MKSQAEKGGETAGRLRKRYEEETGHTVISDQSYIEERKRLSAEQNSDPDESDEADL